MIRVAVIVLLAGVAIVGGAAIFIGRAWLKPAAERAEARKGVLTGAYAARVEFCDFVPYTELPAPGPKDRIVQSWDTALSERPTSCYSVCTTWLVSNDSYYLLDVLRKRLVYPVLKRCVVEHAEHWNANSVIIEDRSTGSPLLQELLMTDFSTKHWLEDYQPEFDKATRLHACTAVIEGGRVFVPAEADWLETLRAELVQFPGGSYDDQVDSISQFLDWAEERRLSMDGMIGHLDDN